MSQKRLKVAQRRERGKATAIIISRRRLCRDLLRAYLTSTIGLSVTAEANDLTSLTQSALDSNIGVIIWCGASAQAADGSAFIPPLTTDTPLLMLLCDDAPPRPSFSDWRGKVAVACCREGLHGLLAGLNRVLEMESIDAHRFVSPHAPEIVVFTKRQQEVVERIARGWTNERIAKSLGLSPRTVERHRANAMKRLGARSTGQLVGEAVRQSLIKLIPSLAED